MLALAGCLKPPPGSGASAPPGSAASIGGGAAAAATAESARPPRRRRPRRRPSVPSTPGAAIGNTGFKECGAEGLIDDGEDGNNQNLPDDNRGGYWYTFRDKKGTTIEPVAGEDGGTFAMSEGGHGSQFAARFHGKIGTGAPLFAGMGMNFVDPKAPYDASKYAGISFWAKKGENSTPQGAAQGAGREHRSGGRRLHGVLQRLRRRPDADHRVEAVHLPVEVDEADAGLGQPAQAAHHAVEDLRHPVPGQRPVARTTTSTSTT